MSLIEEILAEQTLDFKKKRKPHDAAQHQASSQVSAQWLPIIHCT